MDLYRPYGIERHPCMTMVDPASLHRSPILPANFRVIPTGPARRSPMGLAVSVLVHLLIGVLLLVRIRQDFVRVLDAGSTRSGLRGGGGGGGGSVAYISLPAETPRAAVPEVAPPPVETPPPVPVEPTPVPPVTTPPVAEPPPVAASTAGPVTGDTVAGVGPGQGGGTGGGTGGGQGPGSGPGSGPGNGTGGDGGMGRAAEPRHVIIPPADPPKELRGIDLEVTFFVLADGTVDRVEVKPAIKDRKFARKVDEAMRGYRFKPALSPTGIPIASTFVQTMRY